MPEPTAAAGTPRATAPNDPGAPARPGTGTAPSPSGTSTTPATTRPPAGDSAARLAWVQQELQHQLAAYRRRRKRDKRKSFGLQMATVILSATITVLLGVRATGTAQDRLADIALALGAIITVLAAAEAFFAHRGLWMLRTETVRNLEAFARHLDYYQAGLASQPPDPATVEALRAELEGILTADHTAWQHLRASSGTPGTADTTANRTPPATTRQVDLETQKVSVTLTAVDEHGQPAYISDQVAGPPP
jgi:hypothetical protein